MSIVRERKARNAAVAAESVQYVTFEVGKEEFGLSISAIMEVVRPLPITRLPRMPQFVEGIINLRGMIIPVVDLRSRFGLTPASSGQRMVRILIIRGALRDAGDGRDLLGLVVDRVREVLHIPAASIEVAPEAATGQGADFIAGVAKAADRLIILLDVARILSHSERTALAEVDDVHP